ncbi:MAG: putative GTP-binding protein EngB [Paracidovorax wautersii]|uniref:Probable GTP-binding protein EngB n=1 Tax=Paracidovorax wautersii TaxID=1177982 RepID=A0A7V8FQE9_9BURK|nr:MAG: putative GTP-binding protein EngB [Paracidovorax wautersii]
MTLKKTSPSAAQAGSSHGKPHPYAKAEHHPEKVAALGWMHTARFLTTAPQLEWLPPHAHPEIAFVGRSNAGKSTAINTLTQQTRLAFASKKPGRTQHINLFSLGKQGTTDAVLADLPGYGYAAVPKDAKIRWQRVMANYLMTRENLMGVVLMCDPRLGLTELDELLLEAIRPRVEKGLKFLILLTKSDKLTRTEATKALSIARLQAGGGEAKLFSAMKKQGVDDAALLLRQWVDQWHAERPAVAPLPPVDAANGLAPAPDGAAAAPAAGDADACSPGDSGGSASDSSDSGGCGDSGSAGN